MPDMLVSLVELPPITDLIDKLRAEGITITRPHPWQQSKLRDFIYSLEAPDFPRSWAEEVAVAFTHQPVSAFIALRNGSEIVGFSAYECTRRNYFGPTGVDPAMRGKGVGKALFVAALAGLQSLGYTYAIIGGAGPTEFYAKTAGAIPIPLRDQMGIYRLVEDPLVKSLR
jgi:GNAT superfamily N-acetyltransferase